MIIKEKSPLHQIKWNRIVVGRTVSTQKRAHMRSQLDEAHNIKERSTNTAKAAFELQSNNRWCLSGTPLQNRVGELYSLVRFLGGDPFSFYFCMYRLGWLLSHSLNSSSVGKKCDCKSLHWKFSDKRTCDGMMSAMPFAAQLLMG